MGMAKPNENQTINGDTNGTVIHLIYKEKEQNSHLERRASERRGRDDDGGLQVRATIRLARRLGCD